ncbi:MAG: 16S rRNA (guanine(527)-N(7))-methyltransferase RsmG [Phycisphaerales bacterium]|nr:16S rRNA (guanine(527)-N(7))-methyltransferase RsmG [Phycisphaerales bacterium]
MTDLPPSAAPPPPPPAPPDLNERLADLGIELDPGDEARLGAYLARLRAGNEKCNLTRIIDDAGMWERHIIDSLSLLPIIVATGAERVVDVGSGGGLPGIPLAIACPALEVTLLEATGKKATFLEEMVRDFELEHVRVKNARAEDYGGHGAPGRGRYDIVTARAVGRLPVLLELTVPLARVGGFVLAIKGAQATTEVMEAHEALKQLRAEVIDTHRTETGTIVVIEKLRPTPAAFPRRAGEPKRAPLG